MKKFLAPKTLVTIVVLVLAAVGIYQYEQVKNAPAPTRYVTAPVQRGTIVVSVSASGQVSTHNQVDVKPKVSGTVVSVGVVDGQPVGRGAVLAFLDTTDAQKAVRDAQANLDSAKLSLAKLIEPADALSVLEAETALSQATESKTTANANLEKAYDDGFNTVANAFLDLPTIIAGVQNTIYGTNFGGGQWNIDYYVNAVQGYDNKINALHDDTLATYASARTAYDATYADYKSASRYSDHPVIESLVRKTYETTKTIAEAVKSTTNLIQFYEDKLVAQNIKPSTIADSQLTTLSSYTGKTNTHLLNLYTIIQSMADDKTAIVNADRDIAAKTESLSKLKRGADPIDIQSQRLAVTQRENALADARTQLPEYTIRSPFDGIAAKENVKVGDTVSPGTAIATVIERLKIAEVPLNEVDVAKVKVGQHATLKFDAIPGLEISGEVAEIDTLGTTTQGVVTYTVKVAFDTQDDRVKPGMSATATIITDVRQDVVVAPKAAVKLQAGGANRGGAGTYVEMLDSSGAAQQHPVDVGLSNDTSAEIVSGLSVGDVIVTQTIKSGATSSTTPATTGFRIPGLPGGGGGGGGAFRVGGGRPD